jgi:thiol:disulfide interchange protein DsbD
MRHVLISLIVMLGVFQGVAQAEESFLPVEQAFALSVLQPSSPDEPVRFRWTIAPGYYLYRDRIAVTAQPSGAPVDFVRPASEQKNDPNFGPMEVYHSSVAIQAKAPDARTQSMTVTWQGCAEAGLCYPPQMRTVTIEPSATDTGHSAPAVAGAERGGTLLDVAGGNDGDVLSLIEKRSLAWTLPLFFAFGIALAFTPCVLPMVPIVSSIVVGNQATPRRALALSLAFVLPMALTYAILGVAAAVAGANLQALLQNRWTLLAFGAVFVVLACGMFGFFTLQLPAVLRDRLDSASRCRRGGTMAGAAGMGALSALLVGPCMTAPLAGTLLYIAQSGNAVRGGLLLLFLGLGMGVPLLVVGTVGARYLPNPGQWMDRVKGAFGFLLLGTAIWMVQRVVSEPVSLGLWGSLQVGLAVTLYQLAAPEGEGHERASTGARILLCSAALLAGLWGGAMVLGAARGAGDPLQPLGFVTHTATPRGNAHVAGAALLFKSVDSSSELQKQIEAARDAGKPVLVDFYADWCVSCKSIEKEVFGDAQVQHALRDVVLLRADVTASNPAQMALMRAHQIIGPPTVMLFDAQGRERRGSRLVGDFTAGDLIRRQPPGGDRS